MTERHVENAVFIGIVVVIAAALWIYVGATTAVTMLILAALIAVIGGMQG